MFDIEKIAEQLSSMTLVQASKLIKALEKKLGIENTSRPDIATGDKKVETSVKSSFDVVLKATGKEKIKMIKAVKDCTGLGLKEARDQVYSLSNKPIVLKKNVSLSSAETIKKKFLALGGEIEIVEIFLFQEVAQCLFFFLKNE